MSFDAPQFSIYKFTPLVKGIVIHHSLTKDGKTVSTNAIRNYHINELGWIDIGYNFVLEDVNDNIEILFGRPLHTEGAHCKQGSMNNKSIGICCVGNYDVDRVPEPMFKKLCDLCTSLCYIFKLHAGNIRGHNYYAPHKSCPGKNFEMERLRFIVATQLS